MVRRQLSAELTAYQSAKPTAHHGEVSCIPTNALTHSHVNAFLKRILTLYISAFTHYCILVFKALQLPHVLFAIY